MKEKNEIKIINDFMEAYTRILIVKKLLENYKYSNEIVSDEFVMNLYKSLTDPICYVGLNTNGEYRINDYYGLYKIYKKRTILKEVLNRILSITNKAYMSNNVDTNLFISEIDANVSYLVERGVL